MARNFQIKWNPTCWKIQLKIFHKLSNLTNTFFKKSIKEIKKPWINQFSFYEKRKKKLNLKFAQKNYNIRAKATIQNLSSPETRFDEGGTWQRFLLSSSSVKFWREFLRYMSQHSTDDDELIQLKVTPSSTSSSAHSPREDRYLLSSR